MSRDVAAYLTFIHDRASGVDHPIAFHQHLGSALEHGRTAGVNGTHTGVRVIEVLNPLDGQITYGRRVIDRYLDGLRTWSWGVLPESVSELTEEEKDRLDTLRKQLGDLAPTPNIPAPVEETGRLATIWHRPQTTGGAATIVGFVRLIRFADGAATLSEPEPRIAKLREDHPEIPRMHVTELAFGETFTLTEDHATWSEPVGITEMSEADRQAVIDEYTALARKAGLL